VLALDARAHGRSDRRPADVSRAAHVADVVFWLNEVGLVPVRLVGQSLGGNTAFLVAARYPEVVSALVVAESTPAPAPHSPEAVRRWLESWPVPFASAQAALTFFGGDTLRARAWSSGLETNADGLTPRFDIDMMVASIDALAQASCWDDWAEVQTPTLVVRAEHGVPRDETLRMIETNPQARLVEIADAGHDVHLEKPAEWKDAVGPFLAQAAEGR
jgi:pimeloyl-ACP methyl ester carboxylesterase